MTDSPFDRADRLL
jgi:WASH complex subunit strumpellin